MRSPRSSRGAHRGARRAIYGATPRLIAGKSGSTANSEMNARPGPRLRSRRGARDGVRGFAPAVTRIAPWPPAPCVEHALAARVETKEPDDARALRRRYRMLAADQLVVRHAAIREYHRAPRARAHRRPVRAPLAEHDCIEQVAFESDEALGGAVVVRAWQRRDEVDVSRRPPLDEAPARDLDRDVDADGRRMQRGIRDD